MSSVVLTFLLQSSAVRFFRLLFVLLFVRLRRLRLCSEEVRQLLLPLGRRRFAAAITLHRVDTNDLLERSTG